MEKSLPSIKVLFQDSWSRFTKHIPTFLIFQLAIPIALVFAITIPVAIIAFLTWKIPVIAISTIGLGMFFLVISLWATGNALIIRIGSDEKLPVGDSLRKGASFILPTFLIGMLVSFLIYGGIFLFIIPGIVMSFFLGFYIYEILIEGNRGMVSVRNSATIFKQHAWEITGRILLWALIVMGIFFIFGSLLNKNPGGGIFVQIVSYLFGWFGVVYGVTLYKQARAITDFKKPASMTWIYAVSAVGWIFGIVVIASIIALSVAYAKPALEKATMQKQLQETKKIEQSF